MNDVISYGSSPAQEPGPPTRVARRRYLIDPKRQLRAAVMTTSLVAALVILINIGFATLRSSQTSLLSAAAPRLEPVLQRQDTTFTLVAIVLSVILVAAVSIKTIIETHRTAGAVFAVRQRLERVAAGDLQVTLRLRRADNLQDLEQPFNRMVASLRKHTLSEALALEGLASMAAKGESSGPEIAKALRQIIRQKRQTGS